MDTSTSSPLASFKSKKLLHLSPSDKKKSKASSCSDLNPLSVNTPGKTVDPPRKLRRLTAVMSVNEVRQAAMKLRKCESGRPGQPELGSEPGRKSFSPSKKKRSLSVELPEKYVLLEEFFNSMESSIRLLRLKGSLATFTNISLQVGCLTERRFMHSHLAQMKFVMPDAIALEKTLQYDERTSCMKPDLLVTLNLDTCEMEGKIKAPSKNLLLRKVFHGRLLDLFKSQPEGHEIPEGALPEPFGRPKENTSAKSCQDLAPSSTTETPNIAKTASHLSPSFRRFFTPRPANHTEKVPQDISVMSSSVSEPKSCGISSRQENIPTVPKSKLSFEPQCEETCSSHKVISGSTPSFSPLSKTPVKYSNFIIKDEDHSPSLLKTPVECASTPLRLMTATPALLPPKRSFTSSFTSPSKLVRRQPLNRPLKFDTPVKKNVAVCDDSVSSGNSSDDDILDILQEPLVNSIREKEMKIAMEQDPAISQAKQRREMIANLPKLFDMVYYFFQSIGRSVVTKEEVIHKVISGNLQIVDRREVEEQLVLLKELVPEWIREKSSITGDILLCVSKISSPEAIRVRLDEAK